MAVVVRGVGDVGRLQTGGHDVDDVADLVSQATARLDDRRPTDDQRRGYTAFVDPVLVTPKGCIAGVGPGNAVALVGIFRAGHDTGVVADEDCPAGSGFAWDARSRPPRADLLGTPAVVGQKHDQRVLFLADLLEFLEDPADPAVHVVDLRGVDFHPPLMPLAERHFQPGLDPAVARHERPLRPNYPLADHPLVASLAELIPAHGVLALVSGDVFGSCMKRPVRGGVGHVEEERSVAGGALGDVLHRMVADCVSVIILALGGTYLLIAASQ